MSVVKVAPLSVLHCTARPRPTAAAANRVVTAGLLMGLAVASPLAAAQAAGLRQAGAGGASSAQVPTVPTPPPPDAPAAAANPTAVTPSPPAAPPTFRDAVSGIEVYTALDAEMFPASWRDPSIGASAKPLVASETARAVRLMQVALSKYPAPLLQANLERVYVVDDLTFQGISASGTNSSNRLYIVLSAKDPLYTDAFVEESFHHEFSHMLRRNFPDFLSDADWSRNNAPGFQYGAASGVDAVKTGHASLLPTDEWNRRGFLSEYGSEDAAEDFAVIAGGMFTGDTPFWQRMDRFVALKAKLAAAIGFYSHLAPSFTESYFRGLHPGLAFIPRTTPLDPLKTVAQQTGAATVAPTSSGSNPTAKP